MFIESVDHPGKQEDDKADIDAEVLKALIRQSVRFLQATYPSP